MKKKMLKGLLNTAVAINLIASIVVDLTIIGLVAVLIRLCMNTGLF